jgi:hypothetical protein
MSINALANAATARRVDFAPLNTVPRGLAEIATAATTPPTAPGPQSLAGSNAPTAPLPSANAVNTALHILFGYIPTEVLTLYVAVLAAIHQKGTVARADWIIFWSFLVGTPLAVLLVYAGKVRAAQPQASINLPTWPIWEMLAATAAYFAWAFALPDPAFSEYPWYSPALAGIIVLVTSTILGLVAPLFQRPIKP